MSLFVVGGIIAVLNLLGPHGPYRISSNMEVEMEKGGSEEVELFLFIYFFYILFPVCVPEFLYNGLQ